MTLPWIIEQTAGNRLPDGPWPYTDDTEMALAVVETLTEHGAVDQDVLAGRFAERFAADPGRGYGAGARGLLAAIGRGGDWRSLSRGMFGGAGSYGNGAAMRVAPLGMWFADDLDATVLQAERSATVTHTHPEGVAGAVAVALAAGWAWRWRRDGGEPADMLTWVAGRLPACEVRQGIERAAGFPPDAWAFDVAAAVGCGERISAMDTVPYCLWMAAAHLGDFTGAMWTTARVGGDADTNCAIVGGILAASVPVVPDDWLRRREPLR